MVKEYDPGVPVIYVDPHGVPRPALVTIWWSQYPTREDYLAAQRKSQELWAKQDPPVHATVQEVSCNVVLVSDDKDRKDQYGRQLERVTSVVHKSGQSAPGNYWMWPDEA